MRQGTTFKNILPIKLITKILASARQLINEAHTIYALKRTKTGKAEPASAKMKKKKEEKIIQEKSKRSEKLQTSIKRSKVCLYQEK